MSDDHYITREEWAALLATTQRRRINIANLIIIGATVVALVFVVGTLGPELLYSYGMPAETIRALFRMPTPGPQRPTPAPPSRPPGSQGAPVVIGGPLPDCATVTDTRTACVRTEAAQVEPTPPPPPEPTPPAYETVCLTAPGERPCWLPADAPWEPPADVPATPLVLLAVATDTPLVFADAACANWHPPMPYPEGCDDE